MLTLKEIELYNGQKIQIGSLTVLIGPNNGGKSSFLRDVALSITDPQARRTAIHRVVIKPRNSWSTFVDEITSKAQLDENNHLILDAPNADMSEGKQRRFPSQNLQYLLTNGEAAVLGVFGWRAVTSLKTDTRLKLADRHINKDVNFSGAQSTVHAADLASPETMIWIDNQVQAAFPGRRLAVDNGQFAQLRFVMTTDRALPTDYQERRDKLASLRGVHEQGDGIRAFVGLLAAAKTSERPIILIDEPEAFLHPPQAYVMGRAIASLTGAGHQIMVATHSADVLRGLLAEGNDLQVVRLASDDNQFTIRVLDTEVLKKIADDPVLSSVRVLDGLFYNSVVIVESDGDLVVYRRVLELIDASGTVHFVNSYAKQVSSKLAEPFNALGVPCAIIVDFDILRVRDELRQLTEGVGCAWQDIEQHYAVLINEMEVSDDAIMRLEGLKTDLANLLTTMGEKGSDKPEEVLEWFRREAGNLRDKASVWKELKRTGKAKLTAAASVSFDEIDQRVRARGLFIVPVGEREAWLSTAVPYTSNKPRWTEQALKHIGANGLTENEPVRIFMHDVLAFCRLGAKAT